MSRPPPEIIETMAKAINDLGWRKPSDYPGTDIKWFQIWRDKWTRKAEAAIEAAATAGWVLVPADQVSPAVTSSAPDASHADKQAAYAMSRLAWTEPPMRRDAPGTTDTITARLPTGHPENRQ